MATPTTENLRQAIQLIEQIERLRAQLNSVLNGTGSGGPGYGSPGTTGKKRGRKPGTKAAKQAEAPNASDETTAAPKKRGRKPGSKNVVKTADAGAGSVQKKRTMSPEARERIAEAQRQRWAKQKKAGK